MTRRVAHKPASTTAPRTARGPAWGGTILGLTASTAANVLHAVDLGKGGTPAIIGAAFWPLALLAATETLSRKQWPRAVRPWAVAAVVLVAVVTAIVSYGHLRALLISWGAGPVEATIAPLAVDGLMTVCSLAMTVADAPPTAPELHDCPVLDSPSADAATRAGLTSAAAPVPAVARPVTRAEERALDAPGTEPAAVSERTGPARPRRERRSRDELRLALSAAIAERRVPEAPTVEQVRASLGCRKDIASELTRELRAIRETPAGEVLEVASG